MRGRGTGVGGRKADGVMPGCDAGKGLAVTKEVGGRGVGRGRARGGLSRVLFLKQQLKGRGGGGKHTSLPPRPALQSDSGGCCSLGEGAGGERETGGRGCVVPGIAAGEIVVETSPPPLELIIINN